MGIYGVSHFLNQRKSVRKKEMAAETREQVIADAARAPGIKLPLESLSKEERKSAYLEISTHILSKHLREACDANGGELPT